MNLEDTIKALYAPLKRNEIRLLKFDQAGECTQHIRATLEVHSRREVKEKYATLSYVWGAVDDPGQIKLNGHHFSVTRNLYDALLSLRDMQPEFEDSIDRSFGDFAEYYGVWIDALCINQADFGERSEQVQHMRDIYSEAFYTAVWLGRTGEEARYVADTLGKISELQTNNKRSSLPNRKVTDIAHLARLGLPPPESIVWQGLKELLSQPYFERVWPIQEMMVSQAPWVHWGPSNFPLARLLSAAQFIEETGLGILVGNYIWIPSILRLQFSKRRWNLLELLIRTKDFLSTDPCDKIYALLGIASDTAGIWGRPQLSIEINYRLPVEEVYIAFAEKCIRQSGSLNILEAINGTDGDYELPSWVPDWSKKADRPSLSTRYEVFSASAGERSQAVFTNDNRYLHVRGILFDKISNVSSHPWGDWQTSDGLFPQLSSHCREWLTMGKNMCAYSSEPSFLAAWCETITGDWVEREEIIGDSREHLAEVLRLLNMDESAWQTLANSKPRGLPRLMLPLFSRISECCADALFFITERGYMGVGPQYLKSGDSVYIVRGANAPLILRDSDKTPPAGENLIGSPKSLIGEAYVHGIMKGEAYNPSLLEGLLLV